MSLTKRIEKLENATAPGYLIVWTGESEGEALDRERVLRGPTWTPETVLRWPLPFPPIEQ